MGYVSRICVSNIKYGAGLQKNMGGAAANMGGAAASMGGAAANMGGAAANMGGASPHCQLPCSSLQQTDVLLFVRESGENFTVPIVTSTYSNLKVNRYRGHFKHARFHLQA